MTDLFEILGRYQTTSSGLAGWELASDRGNLSADDELQFAELKTSVTQLYVRAKTRWDDASPEDIAAYDARVDVLATLELADPMAPDAKRRAPATRSPARAFDASAIWSTLKLTAG